MRPPRNGSTNAPDVGDAQSQLRQRLTAYAWDGYAQAFPSASDGRMVSNAPSTMRTPRTCDEDACHARTEDVIRFHGVLPDGDQTLTGTLVMPAIRANESRWLRCNDGL